MNERFSELFDVAPDDAVREKGVYCRGCGAQVVGRSDFHTVRVGPDGRLAKLPFECLKHRCPTPKS